MVLEALGMSSFRLLSGVPGEGPCGTFSRFRNYVF